MTHKDKESDEIALDLTKIKGFFKKSKKTEKETSEHKEEPSVQDIDWNKALAWSKKHVWVFLLLIVVFFSVWFRAYPAYLPITDDWAENSVSNYYQNQITAQIQSQYPNLPEANRNALVKSEYEKVKKQQKDVMAQQVKATSQQFKAQLQDADGQTYLLAIDPYLWYGYARNYIENGQWGDTYKDGESWYSLRNGREGQKANFIPYAFIGVVVFPILNLFGSYSIMSTMFYLPVILMCLAAIFAFFIGKHIAGLPGGLTAGLIVGAHGALLNRTVAGFSDTDNVITVFEMLSVLLIFLAFSEKEDMKRWAYVFLAAVSMGLYANMHESWWHIFDFVIGAIGIWLLYHIWSKRKKHKWNVKATLENTKLKLTVEVMAVYAIATLLSGSFIRFAEGFKFMPNLVGMIKTPFLDPLWFIQAKQVGVKTIWPNVLTTVAELNRGSISSVLSQVGSNFVIFLSLAGMVYLVFRKDSEQREYLFHGLLLIFWFLAAVYAATTSVRFIAFVVPVFALGMAAFVAMCWNELPGWSEKTISVNKNISRTLIAVALIILVFMPLASSANATAKNEIPSMNDAWYNTLIKIHDNSDDGIITSWWDFGHWFVAVGQRKVTFDGGDQGERIHWVGRTLREDNETQAVGILRMLNCAQEKAPHRLSEMLGGGIQNDVKAIDVLYSIFSLDKEQAREAYLENGLSEAEAEEMLSLTHCDDLIPQYYITSEDMVGKAGVWAHFGSWDFHKAAMFNQVKGKDHAEGTKILIDQFGMEQADADKTFFDIQATDGDTYISPWPGYVTGVRPCQRDDEAKITCVQSVQGQQFSIHVNLMTGRAEIKAQQTFVPNSVVYVTETGTVEMKQEGSPVGFSIVLIPAGDGYNSILTAPEIANSMFTRMFFMKGHGLKHFKQFDDTRSITGGRIITWTVDWEGENATVAFAPKTPEKSTKTGEKPVAVINETVEASKEEPANGSG